VDRELLRADEAAELLGLGRSKTYQLMAAGELPTVRIGRSVRIPLAALRAWVAERTVDGGSFSASASPTASK
jgi:excisionase family DNA binding protein